jgi:hypothetical protein
MSGKTEKRFRRMVRMMVIEGELKIVPFMTKASGRTRRRHILRAMREEKVYQTEQLTGSRVLFLAKKILKKTSKGGRLVDF